MLHSVRLHCVDRRRLCGQRSGALISPASTDVFMLANQYQAMKKHDNITVQVGVCDPLMLT